jgi:hypothetical protein
MVRDASTSPCWPENLQVRPATIHSAGSPAPNLLPLHRLTTATFLIVSSSTFSSYDSEQPEQHASPIGLSASPRRPQAPSPLCLGIAGYSGLPKPLATDGLVRLVLKQGTAASNRRSANR